MPSAVASETGGRRNVPICLNYTISGLGYIPGEEQEELGVPRNLIAFSRSEMVTWRLAWYHRKFNH